MNQIPHTLPFLLWRGWQMKENTSLGMNRCFPAHQDGVARLHSACVLPSPYCRSYSWSSCSERWGRNPCLSPGIDLMSTTGHVLILSPRSEIISAVPGSLCSAVFVQQQFPCPPRAATASVSFAGLLGWMQCAAGHLTPIYQILSKHLL